MLYFGHMSSGSFARYCPMNFGTYPAGTAGVTKWDELSVEITNVAEGGRVEVEVPGPGSAVTESLLGLAINGLSS